MLDEHRLAVSQTDRRLGARACGDREGGPREDCRALVHSTAPLVLDPALAEDATRLADLRASGAVWRENDSLALQLRDLVDSRFPEVDLTPAQLESESSRILGGTPESWGRWVFYPWSGRLVHLLPPNEFRELRLDRNRFKITPAESDRLASVRVGIAGLSVGNAIALTLALEGGFGHLRLADHDRLELSNMNRIRAGVHEIGLPKTVLAAQQIWEIDPYASVSLMDDGVTADNIDAFLEGLDVVIDECDSIYLKFLLRERARERRLPVLMETSDRGMLDVERFDLTPERPLFHGLTGGITAAELRGLDADDRKMKERKAAVIARLLDAGMISTRLAASMIEVDSSLSTWPQLASDVLLGGASAAVAVRRLALGQPLPSGRRYVDLERAVAEPRHDVPLPSANARRPSPRPAFGAARPGPSDDVPELARYLVAHATLAPSGGNAQPWHFYWGDERLWVAHDRERSRNILDSRSHASWLALGAAVENAAIAAAARGLQAHVEPFPCDGVAAAIRFERGSDERLAALLPLVVRRQTNRKLGRRVALPDGTFDALRDVAALHGASVQLVDGADDLEEVGRIIGASDRLRFLCPLTHRELVAELRWSAEDAERTRDGVTVSSLALEPGGQVAVALLTRPDVAALLRRLELGRRLEESAADSLAAASAAGLLTLPVDSPEAWLAGGRAMQRVWLEATARDVALQPMTVVLYLLELVRDGVESAFSSTETAELASLEERLYRVFEPPHGRAALLFRLARIDEPAERSLRLPPESVLSAGIPDLLEHELL